MFRNCNKLKSYIKNVAVLLLTPYYLIKIYLLKRKSKKMIRGMRVNLYKQYPPMQGDVGIGYRNGKLYDYIDKKYVK